MESLFCFVDSLDLHLDASVIEQDAAACSDFIRQFVVGDCGDLLIAAHRT